MTVLLVLVLVIVSGVVWRHVRQEHPVEDAVPAVLCDMFSTEEFSEVAGVGVHGFWLGGTRQPGSGRIDIDCRIDVNNGLNYNVNFVENDSVILVRRETEETMRQRVEDAGEFGAELSIQGLPGPSFVQVNPDSGYHGYAAWFSPAGYTLGIEVTDSLLSVTDEELMENLPRILEYLGKTVQEYYPGAAVTSTPSPSATPVADSGSG